MHREKNLLVAYILWLLLGIFGAHKFYLGRPVMGVLYLFTCGLLLIGWLIDLFTLPQQLDEYYEQYDPYGDDDYSGDDEIEDLLDEIAELREMVRSDNSSDDLDQINQRLATLEKMVTNQNHPS